MGARSGVCTHGPDPAPAGRDVRAPRSTAELRAEAGLGPMPSPVATTPGTTVAPTDGTGAIVCTGDGVTGKRVEVLYVRPADKTDRFDSIKDALGQYVVRADRQLNASAAETGGSRHWRFVTDPDPAGAAACVLRITKVDVGSADDDSFDASIAAIKARGYNQAGRKYLMFVESNVYCGIGSLYRDSQPGQANINNGTLRAVCARRRRLLELRRGTRAHAQPRRRAERRAQRDAAASTAPTRTTRCATTTTAPGPPSCAASAPAATARCSTATTTTTSSPARPRRRTIWRRTGTPPSRRS